MIYRSLSCDEVVRACVDSANTEAWQEFVCRFGPSITLVVRRIMVRYGEYDPDLLKDLVQDVFFKLCDDQCRVLRKFNPQHEDAFYGMVKVMAANVVHDHFRGRHSSRRWSGTADSELSDVEGFIADPRASNSDHFERRILLQEIDRIVRAHATPRDRQIFWLYYGQAGLTAAEIARIKSFALNEKGVESVLHRLKSLVRQKLAENGNGDRDPNKAA